MTSRVSAQIRIARDVAMAAAKDDGARHTGRGDCLLCAIWDAYTDAALIADHLTKET